MANKQPRTIEEQITLLKQRGMLFENEELAADYLGRISYYRLKGYWWDMQQDKEQHIFYPNTTFEKVIERYYFDQRLRLILFEAIEMLEIALRTKLIQHLSISFGGLWYLEETLFNDKNFFAETVIKLQGEFVRSKEVFAIDYRNRYPNMNPDAWIILEVASLGTLSKIYKNLNHQLREKSRIANEFGLNLHKELSSWLESVAYLRNIIAHHSRIWSKNMVKRPITIFNPKYQWFVNSITDVQEKKPFMTISALLYLCNSIEPKNSIKTKLLNLIEQYPDIPIYKIGFLNNWQNELFWGK